MPDQLDLEKCRIGWIGNRFQKSQLMAYSLSPGLGSMGTAMATNLSRYLLQSPNPKPLRVYNRTASRCTPLVNDGAISCKSIEELTLKSDMIFISVSDDNAAQTVFDEMVMVSAGLAKVVVDTSTVHPDTTKELAQQSQKHGIQFIAAPVFGATPMAKAGQLLVAAAGPQHVVGSLVDLLKNSFARDVLFVSEMPEKAVLLKTLGNIMIAGIMEIVAEAHVVAEKSGLGSDILESLIQQNFGTLAYSNSLRMTTGVYIPGSGQQPYSGLDLALKDVGHGVSCAQSVGATLPVGELIHGHLVGAKQYSDEHDGRLLDSSSMYGVLREAAGLDFKTELVKERDSDGSSG